jgi:diphthamide synthase (EF-2-diphthine--ammonia ligase)
MGLGFKACIVVLRGDKLGKEFLGKTIDRETVAGLEKAGVDASGELGEYHTVVTAGPAFSSEITVKTKRRIRHDGYWFLELESI